MSAENQSTYTITRHREGLYRKGKTDVLTVTPKEVNPDTPRYVIVPGYSANGNSKLSENVAVRLASETGAIVDVFTVSGYLRGHKLSKQTRKEFPDLPKKNKVRKSGISSLETNRAAALLRNLRKRKITDARVVAHSLGIQSSAIAMSLDKEGRIKDGAGVASAGINEERPVKKIIRRFGTDSIKEKWQLRKNPESKASLKKIAMEGVKMFFKHPIRFTWHEIRATKYGNVKQPIINSNADLRFLAGTTDGVFGDKAFSKDLSDQMTVYEGGHNRLYTHPDFIKKELIPIFDKNNLQT